MAKTIRLTPERLAEELATCEREHGMSSYEFFEHYQAGELSELGESEAGMRWAWLCSVALRSGTLVPARADAGAIR